MDLFDPKPALDLIARPVQLVAYQVWHRPGVEDRYAATPEEQERLARERAGRPPDAAPVDGVGP